MTIQQYIRLSRPRTLVAAVGPVLLGSSFSYINFIPFPHMTAALINVFLLLFTVVIAQVAVNIANEYYDYRSGLDKTQVVGNSGLITREGMSPSAIAAAGKYTGMAALFFGFLLCWRVSFALLPIGLFCMAIGFFYSGGPRPISSTPFGEIASGFAMGFTIVLLTAYSWTQQLHWTMLIPAVPSLILVASIMLTNNIRDIKNDRSHGRRTLAIIVGRDQAIDYLAKSFIFVFAWTLFWTFFDFLPAKGLIVLLCIPLAKRVITILRRYSDVTSLDEALATCAKLNLAYSILLSFGLILHQIL